MTKPFDFYRLPNGVRVVLVPMQGVESVALGVYVGSGTRDESWQTNGLAHFLEHMVFKGTKALPTRQDTSLAEKYGAVQNGWTYSQATAYWCKLPADKWRLGLEVQKELSLYPLLKDSDLKQERGVIMEEIHRRDDDPESKVWEVFDQARYPKSSLGWSTLGREEVIKQVQIAEFKDFHRQNYVSGNLLVAMAGKMDNKNKVKHQIQKWFGGLQEAKGLNRRQQKEATGPRVEIATKADAKQAHIVLGVGAFDMGDRRRFALGVLNRILGYGLSSRLFMEIREKRGLAYSIHSDYELERDYGHFAVYAGLKVEKLALAIKAIVGELRKCTRELVPPDELQQAKEKVRGPMIFSMENPYHQMNFYAHQVLWRPGEVISYDQVLDKVMTVTAKEVRQVARDLFKTGKLTLAVVGPVEKKEEEKLLKLLRV